MNGEVDPRIALAAMLIGLTVEGAQKIHDALTAKAKDDETLAGILDEAQARLAQRS